MADALEAAADVHEVADEAAEAVLAEAADEAEVLSAAGDDAAAEEVVVEAVIETAVIEETADEVGLELVTEAAADEEEIVEAEHLADEAAQGDGDLPVDAVTADPSVTPPTRRRRPAPTRSGGRTGGSGPLPRPRRLVRRPHVRGLREQGEGQPRGQDPHHADGGQDLPGPHPHGRRHGDQVRQEAGGPEEGVPRLSARQDVLRQRLLVRGAEHAGCHGFRVGRHGVEAHALCRSARWRRSSW